MIYIVVIAVGVAIGIYCNKRIDENYANGVYDHIYNDEQEIIESAENCENDDEIITNEEAREESLEEELERLRRENEELKQNQKGE